MQAKYLKIKEKCLQVQINTSKINIPIIKNQNQKRKNKRL